MHVLVKGEVLEFIGLGNINTSIVLCELRQDCSYFVMMVKTRMPHANVMKKVQWEEIQLCAIFGGTIIFSRASGRFKGGWVI